MMNENKERMADVSTLGVEVGKKSSFHNPHDLYLLSFQSFLKSRKLDYMKELLKVWYCLGNPGSGFL